MFVDSIKFRAIQSIPTAVIVLFPLCMIRDMSGFRYVSFGSIISLLYIGILLLIELPEYAHENYSPEKMHYLYFDWNLLTGAALTFFSYTCQINLLPIYSELVNPNERRIKKIIVSSIVVDAAFYITIALAGYFSTYE